MGILICVAIAYAVYTEWSQSALVCILASKDGKRYCVRDRRQLKRAANLLASVTRNMSEMVDYMERMHPDDPRTRRLRAQFQPDRIMETLPTSQLTAYSENKGEKIAFCLNRRKEEDDDLIDLHTLTFVALHELAHLMTESVGHKLEFWENFRFLLQNAKAAGIHRPLDYKRHPRQYCGLHISDNPYYDLS